MSHSFQGLAIVPGHPVSGVHGEFRGVAIQLGEVIEGIGPAEFAGVDQAHEDIPDMGSMASLVK